MKKILLMLLVLIITFSGFNTVFANMAAPNENDLGTSITFKNNEDINITKEILDIKITNDVASIKATYFMSNNKEYNVETESMFISPNYSDDNISVLKNDINIQYTTKDLIFESSVDEVHINDWEYVIFKKDENSKYGRKVQSINFKLEFGPLEESTIIVSYNYRLGGRPDLDNNLRYATFLYYLTPANNWNDFKDLTINLELSSDLPVISKSTLDFIKIENNKYKYKSDTMPNVNLELELDQTRLQEFIGFFKNPYNIIYLYFIGITSLLIILIISIIVFIHFIKRKKCNN